MSKPELNVSVFTDYICPFCYLGSERLQKLGNDYDLKVNWLFVEIHPETPAEGMPVEDLNYSPEHWKNMMQELMEMARQDGLHIAERSFTTNSHKAMLLTEAVKRQRPEQFYCLHNRLFAAFFGEKRNIGDESILKSLAGECGIDAEFVTNAWDSAEYETALQQYLQLAAEHRIRGVPTYIIGDRVIFGASSLDDLKQAAQQTVKF